MSPLEVSATSWSSWANWLGGFAVVFGALATLCTVIGFGVSVKSGKLKSALAKEKQAELETFQLQSKERTAKLEKETQDARLETERIKALTLWRTLNGAQIATLTAFFSQRPLQVRVSIVANDPEAMLFGMRIINLFKATDVSMRQVAYQSHFFAGIAIFGSAEEDVKLVREAFHSCAISFQTEPVKEDGMSTGSPKGMIPRGVEIVIGHKLRTDMLQ